MPASALISRWPLAFVIAITLAVIAAPLRAQSPTVSIERFYSLPSLIGTEPRGVTWSPDSRRVAFLWNEEGTNFLDVYLTTTSTAVPLRITRMPRPDAPSDTSADYATQRDAISAELDGGISNLLWFPDGQRLLYSFRGQLYVVTPGRGEPTLFTRAPGAMQRVAFSPKGDRLAFLRAGDLWVAPVLKDSLGPAQRITTLAADAASVESYSWAPDGRSFAIVHTNRSGINTRRIPNYLTDEVTISEVRRAYPGETSEGRRLAIATLDSAPVRWLDLGTDTTDLIFTYAWSPRGNQLLVDKSDVFVKDRRLLIIDATSGVATQLVREQEPNNVSAEWRAAWAPDGRGVYFTSDRDHDYHVWYAPTNGEPPRAITSGEWAVFGFSVTPRGLFVTANRERAEERHVFRVPLAGGAPIQVSVRAGTHNSSVAPDGRYAAVLFSSDTVPPDLYLTAIASARSTLADERRVTTSALPEFAQYTWIAPQYVTFPSRADSATVHGRLLLPPGYQPGQRVPVIVGSIYSNTVRNQWGGRNAHPLWGLDRVLLERGYAVFALDVAGSSGHGTAFRRRIRLDYGGIDVEDIHSGVEWLVAQGIADSSRIGIWGSSYGGLLTTMSLFTKPGVFKAGIAGAPATNVWHALTGEQRVMSRPQDFPEQYANASSHTKAAGLRDALMIVHGMRDVVVLYRDSVWLVQYLMQLGRPVEFVSLPDAPHGWDTGPLYQTRFAFNAMLEFFDRHLAPDPG